MFRLFGNRQVRGRLFYGFILIKKVVGMPLYECKKLLTAGYNYS